jgi:hypothetical protein
VFDGSVRTFWVAPNYGYFNGSDVTKPTFSEYLKQIYPDKLQQENFSLNGDSKNYTDISEMFSVFEKKCLRFI